MKTLFNPIISGCVENIGNLKYVVTTCFSQTEIIYNTTQWGLKDQGLSPQIKWKLIRHSSTANSFNGRCNFCLDEKISIIHFKNRKLLLNERNKLVFKCRHRGKFRLS